MPHYALNAIGADRPGIIAGLTKDLAAMGANLEDSRMALLGGQFAVMLVLDAPAGVDAAAIESGLVDIAAEFDLLIAVREVRGTSTTGGADLVAVAIHGGDRPGIVAGISAQIAELGANVVDLATHVIGAGQNTSYVMSLSVELPDSLSFEEFEEAMQARSTVLGVHCSVTMSDASLL